MNGMQDPMERETLDQYLDDALLPDHRAAVELKSLSDPRVAALLARLRSERAVRAAAWAAYVPSAEEVRGQAEAVLAMARGGAHAPVGRIGYWVRRISAVAAAAAIVAGAFAMGRATAPAAGQDTTVAVEKPTADRPYTVVYWNNLGEPQVRQFANSADVDSFVTDLQGHQTGQLVSVMQDDSTTLSQEGSF